MRHRGDRPQNASYRRPSMGAVDDSTSGGAADGQPARLPPVESESKAPTISRGRTGIRVAGGILLAAIGISLWPLFAWQSENQRKALSLSNMRRVATGCLTYAEDWDLRMPPPLLYTSTGFPVTWARQVRPYVLLDDAFTNPTNPVKPFAEHPVLHDPVDGHGIETSYALNRRYWNVFAPGPFPVGNIEIPEQTALLVEAGNMEADPRKPRVPGAATPGLAVDIYGDIMDRITGVSPYPATHGGQLGVVAADGHSIMSRPMYYASSDGPHDPLLGRLVDGIYNWNGGHQNGETDSPPHE